MMNAHDASVRETRKKGGILARAATGAMGLRRYLDGKIPGSMNPMIFLGRHPGTVPGHALIFFPCRITALHCGLTGIVYYKNRASEASFPDLGELDRMADGIEAGRFSMVRTDDRPVDEESYLAGKTHIASLSAFIHRLKGNRFSHAIFARESRREALAAFARRLTAVIRAESELLADQMGRLAVGEVDIMSRAIESLKDIAWAVNTEIIENAAKIKALFPDPAPNPSPETLQIFKNINAVLNSIDRLEVRGRDSAGISLMFVLEKDAYDSFHETLENVDLLEAFEERTQREILISGGISVNPIRSETGNGLVSVALTYKVAAEIGSLGDNIIFLRWQIKNDAILHTLVNFGHRYHTVLSHTRWASVGAITEPNCHPVDNKASGDAPEETGTIHVCLNGDIDNYLELKTELERAGTFIHRDTSTDTKIIPLQIEKHIRKGLSVSEAFRQTVNDFEGSHAICMHTDLAPGKLFLAQKGSGQTIFVGLAEDHYMPASEVYGFVEETSDYIKMDGEKVVPGKTGDTQGQIFILDQESPDPIAGIHAEYYDGTPLNLTESDIKRTEITSRDIDRQDFPHYFLKEISESPGSVEKTLQNRWKVIDAGRRLAAIALDEQTFPKRLRTAFEEKRVRRIFFVGQGTAGVAALACANILEAYLDDPTVYINAMKASELSGFKLDAGDGVTGMTDTLVVAISQSGTTTDTNRTVDMVRERGAYTLAIVNRRDSDITFKVDGVMYTSSGRDIEMSVASTKAFYSQIVAGAVLGLKMAELTGRREAEFISREIEKLLGLPEQMRQVLSLKSRIEASANRIAASKTYWAAVGSGPNKASADEIRIKLSELCYKTLSSDFVEDKKHIDLSSEPLIIICAAGTRPTVIGDIIKDTAIFKAHKATPVVIADKGEHRFDPYAADVFHVPAVSEHLAPVINTLVGHIWGYYAALSINEGSKFLYGFRENLQGTIDDYARKGMNAYELVLERSFREKIVRFYREFRRKKAENGLPTALGLDIASDLTLLLKYLAGKLPVPDFEIDFGMKGTASNMINTLMECLANAVNTLARPVDAIKHQAKTVTVGTSRISETVEGILFDALAKYGIGIPQITSSNIIVLRNLQEIVSRIEGAILYKIDNLDLLGEPTEDTTIEVVKKEGVLKPIPSRVEADNRLKGTKRIIVREKNVWIGIGKKDDRIIIVIPIIPASPSAGNIIENLLLLNISFRESVPLPVKIKALGGKLERIINIVQESSVTWTDDYLELVEMKDLFGLSAEKIGDRLVSRLN